MEIEEPESAANKIYKKMRVELSNTLESGALLLVQRQGEHATMNSSMFRNG